MQKLELSFTQFNRQQAARLSALRPVVFSGIRRRQWAEHASVTFVLSLFLMFVGGFTGVLGVTGFFEEKNPLIERPPQQAADFKGVSAKATREAMGAPSLIRHEPPAEVWQYRSEACVLDIYFYDSTRNPRADYAELRDRHSDESLNSPACLATLHIASRQ